MSEAAARRLLRTVGSADPRPTPVTGGDTARACVGGRWFVKTGDHLPPDLFAAEAAALRTLRAHGIPVPDVVLLHDDGLVLTRVPSGHPDDIALGRAIAAMHQLRGPARGTDGPAFLGRVPLARSTRMDSRSFLVDLRLAPLAHRGREALRADHVRLMRAAARLPSDHAPDHMVYDDPWSGNVVHDATGPVLVDPSCPWGDRALDLAMMRLFGGFSARCMAAYAETWPHTPETEAAILGSTLVFLLVHVETAGAGYMPAVCETVRALERAVA